MPDKRTVELHSAFFWICDECGADNFHRGIAAESPFADDHPVMADIREEQAETDGLSGDWIMQPTEVTCDKCGTAFEVETEEAPE